ncbi:protein FAM169B isoform X2 [Clupea harengus]|uniref:Protein FAM169B isoform X2 n=1 Tax=Clupea harengus TaxID=7950 RepID=A0A6P8F919_CLUHA|nr:protein FAM169B isoform X2 [Clupea harengus]
MTGITYLVDCPDEDVDLTFKSEEKMSYLVNDSMKKTFTLPHGGKVDVCHDNIACLSLFSGDLNHSIFALHLPGDETQVVAVYLHREWWSVQDMMKTSCKSRSGLVVVSSIMERVILFLMSQIIFGILERTLDEEIHFSPHPLEEFGKILWQDGEAVGFYTIKKKGTLCNRCNGRSYLLPVLDTLFVRTPWRRKGLALRMLDDFCSSFPQEEALGFSYPISDGMYEVCRKFLEIHQEERDRLYEVESPGDWGQRRNVWLGLQLRRLPKHRQSPQTINTDKANKDKHKEGKVPPLSADRAGPALSSWKTPGSHFEMGGLPTSTIATPDNTQRNSGTKRAADHTDECENTKQRRTL